MHQIGEILSAIGTAITVILGLFAILMFLALWRFRETKADRLIRLAKEQERLAKDLEREERKWEMELKAEEQRATRESEQLRRQQAQRLAELRQMVREEVAAHFARQEPEPIGTWRDSGRD